MAEPRECSDELDGQPVAWLEAEPVGDVPVLYVHGVPTSARIWTPFLERTGGLAPDLPGFGRSGKRADLPYDIPFYAEWIERFRRARGIERVRLVVHDWGAGTALAWAQRHPEAVERLVIVDGVPLLPGYRWHRIARMWRARAVGELVMGATTGWSIRRALRFGGGPAGRPPGAWADAVVPFFDLGTQRAILRLYRSSPEAALADAGAQLSRLTCPALVVWGERDRFISPRFAQAYADALGGAAEVEVVPGAGHWPWYERPEVVDRVAAFLRAD